MGRAAGKLVDHTLRSYELVRDMRLHVYLPPYYGERDVRYPVVYLLHPWGEDDRFWTGCLKVHEVADHLIHAGAIPPLILAMPQGDKSFFIDAAAPGGDYSPVVRLDPEHFAGALEGYGDYGSYLLHDVIPAVEKLFRVRTGRQARAIAGVGMGATGAAVLAFTQPATFCAVGIHSPALFRERLGPPWIFGMGDAAAFAARDPISLARGLRPNHHPRIYLDCGTTDEGMTDSSALHIALDVHGIPHTYRCPPGGHVATYWQARLPEYLGFYAAEW